ncbi:MAG: DUF58 domain-containing protein [Syntrophomonadaceae bacterium]
MKTIKSLYLSPVFFVCLWVIVPFLALGYIWGVFFFAGKILVCALAALLLLDIYILFREKRGISASREVPHRLSNGDENLIRLYLENYYGLKIRMMIIDEIPFQFQKRDSKFSGKLNSREKKSLTYSLTPVERGEYSFGSINIYVSSPLGLAQRKFKFEEDMAVAVYPSFIQMEKYELMAISNRLTELGIKKVRRLGHSAEFEQIKEYVTGDDYRTVNWKATARRSRIMVNTYDEEKSQQVYNVINTGRVMKMPFKGMSLLDYAINTSLVVSKIAIRKHDKAGIITFSDKISAMLPAGSRSGQMTKILETLYRQSTDFLESDYEKLTVSILSNISHRSLIILYTNFETLESVRRQLQFLRRLAVNHLVLVVFFENTELQSLKVKEAEKTEDIYVKTIAEKFEYEKRQIVFELNKHNIMSILTPPESLSVNTINKYLEIKTRGML